jgi:putative Ca2+/H+ antiporter (TMEM165/GDT1 family)
VNAAVMATVFALIFTAELPDKTSLASLILGTRYRPMYVFAGAAAAFTIHAVIAVAAGSVIGMLPHRLLQLLVGIVFLIGAVVLARSHTALEEGPSLKGPSQTTFVKVSTASFVVIMLAELGDMTQIITANLAAKYHDPVAVLVGAVLALWAAAAVAILGGRGLVRFVPLTLIARLAAAVMAVLGIVSIISIISGVRG